MEIEKFDDILKEMSIEEKCLLKMLAKRLSSKGYIGDICIRLNYSDIFDDNMGQRELRSSNKGNNHCKKYTVISFCEFIKQII